MISSGFNSRRTAIGALLLLALVVCPRGYAFRFANQHGKHDYKHEVELLEEQWRVAQLTGDVATMDKLLSDDYVGISMTGQVNTKAQQLSRVQNHSFVLTEIQLGEMKVKLVGQVAVVTVLASVVGTNEGLPMNGVFRYTRVYQHLSAGGWKITNFEATRLPNHGGNGPDEIGIVRKPL